MSSPPIFVVFGPDGLPVAWLSEYDGYFKHLGTPIKYVPSVEKDRLETFLREHGSAIAWCPGAHGKLIDDLTEVMATVAPEIAMPESEDLRERRAKSQAERILELEAKVDDLELQLGELQQ